MSSQHAAASPRILSLMITVLVTAFLSLPTSAQSGSATDGSTPLGLQPGAPAGSYALSGFDNVSLYNGSLNFQLSLLGISGRGGAQVPVLLPIEGKWRVLDIAIPQPDGSFRHHYMPMQEWWENNDRKYRPGSLVGRQGSFDVMTCPDNTSISVITLRRLTFTAPDGTEFELRDQLTGGQPANNGNCSYLNPPSRGRIFVTSDGSSATFVSDSPIYDYVISPNPEAEFYPSGYLMLRDGTRYGIDSGRVVWLRDRNGNKLTFGYDSTNKIQTITDSLNRVVTISRNTGPGTFDQITYKGFAGAQRAIKVNYSSLANALRSDYASTLTYKALFPELDGSSTSHHNPSVISSIILPDNLQQYQIKYNPYGEVARVVLPTGGAIEYDYGAGVSDHASGAFGGGYDGSWVVYRRVIERRIYPDGGTGSSYASRMTYSRPEFDGSCADCVIVEQRNNAGTLLTRSKHYFYGSPRLSFNISPIEYSGWKDGREYQTEEFAADGAIILRRIVNTWEQPISSGSWPLTQAETNASAKANNPQVTQTVTTLEPAQANKVSKQTFAYDKYTNQTDVYEFDFGNGAPSLLPVRRTHTDYLTSGYDTLNPSSSNPDLNETSHIRSLPKQTSIFDGDGVERARTVIEYDNYVLEGPTCLESFHCPLLPRSDISGFDASFTASYTKRGNPTAVTGYLLSGGTGSVSTYSQYDIAGNLVRRIDPRSTPSNIIATSIEYDDRFGAPDNEARSNTIPTELTGLASFAFPTKIINALGHTTYAQFDYYLGKSVNGEDANGVVASGWFDDALDRPKQIRRAVATDAENQTMFVYDDVVRIITTTSDLHENNDNVLVSKVLYDQMGRTKETSQYEGGGNYIAVQTEYDALGRPYKTSNPFRPSPIESPAWTMQAFDALGRVISVTTPDIAVVSTTYSGNNVTVTDQAGKKRKSVTDALGRLIEVYEDPVIPGGPTELNYQTSYTYDALDNLVRVTQGTQQRFFMYDSFKRLIRARNPEQSTHGSLNLSDPITGNSVWSSGYQYDANGNLTVKTDARGVVSTYAYDALNRNTTINYSDTTIDPDVKRFYDGATNGKGRFWHFYSGGDYSTGANVDHTSIDSYDPLGRPLVQRQLFKLNNVWSATYQTTRAYNRAGSVTSQTYPSGHTVSFNYDQAGRMADKDALNLAFTGNLGDGVLRTYARGNTYSPWGSLSREQYGTSSAVYHKLRYNIRGQLCDARASNVDDDMGGELGALINYFSTAWAHCGSGTDNNGNVLMSQTIINSYYMEDHYSYDALNRLTAVNEWQNGSTHSGSQQYDYDRWGNRTIKPASWGTGINTKQFDVETATNRLHAPGDLALPENQRQMRFDAAGNLTNDTYTGVGLREYDAENRMTRAWGGNNQWQYYTYNADGQRVRRKVGNQETWQVYGLDGELLAEYAANGVAANPQKEYGYRNGQLLVMIDSAPGLNGYSNRRTITIDHTKVPNTDQSNFPLLISGTYSYLATVANGGNVQHASGYDVIFSSDSNCATKLDHEVETYNPVSGAVNYWVKVPSLSHSTDTTFYLCYGNASVTTDQSNKTAVWDANYKGVWHLSDDAATTIVSDSTGANNGANQANTSSKSVTGLVGKGLSYNGSSDYTDLGTNVGNYVLSDSFTLEAWINPALDSANRAIYGNAYAMAGYLLRVNTENKARFVVITNGSNFSGRDSSVLASGWHHVVAVWNSAGTAHVYIDGVLDDAVTVNGGSVTTITTSAHTRIGATPESGFGYESYFNGTIDEVRSSKTARSADWIKTQYNNQISPSTFYTISAVAGAAANVRWLVTDHLGTPRMVLDQSGTLTGVRRHDYLPFGEELFAGTGGRTVAQGYVGADGVRQQFTLKERDVETGLDYFINRYYSSMQGRFMSPDAPFADQWEEEPQSWNLYSYVGNQPLNHTDPFGLWREVECTSGKGQCWVSDNKKDTITSLANILGVDANQLNDFLQKPKVKLGQEFDISGFWSWRAGITPGTEPAVVFVDLVDESDIPGDRYSIDVTIGPRFPIRNLGKQAAQKLWNERGKIARQLTKEDNRLLGEFFGQGTRGKLKDLKDFKIPPGLTKQALERYAEIARRAVESGNDKSGVQRDRLELIERALKTLKD